MKETYCLHNSNINEVRHKLTQFVQRPFCMAIDTLKSPNHPDKKWSELFKDGHRVYEFGRILGWVLTDYLGEPAITMSTHVHKEMNQILTLGTEVIFNDDEVYIVEEEDNWGRVRVITLFWYERY